MSILKFENRTPRSLQAMYDYMIDNNKTDRDYIFGIGSNPPYAVAEMQFVQNVYYANILHPYLQVIFSFDSNVNYDMMIIKEICYHIGEVLLIDERQLLGAVHYKNERNIHCHYMINSIGIDGSLYKQKYSVRYYKEKVNVILSRYNLTPIYYNEGNSQFYISA